MRAKDIGGSAMEMVCLLFSFLVFQQLVHGENQSGFISIDCGASNDYTDEATGIAYVQDGLYINTGENKNIAQEFLKENLARQLSNVRSFPEGVKNCYNLTIPQGKNNKYLIRTTFMYGNYDSQNELPEFSVFLGANEWHTVKFENASDIVMNEIIHILETDFIYVCLLKTGSTVPFMSALELRQLNNSIYPVDSGSLALAGRYDVGSTTNQTVRYRDDVYDRIWEPFNSPDWEKVSAGSIHQSLSSNDYKPPSIVMMTGVVPVNDGKILGLTWIPNDTSQLFYMVFHFAEAQDLQANQSRKFKITVNGDLWHDLVNPRYLLPNTVYSSHLLRGIGARAALSFSMNMVEDSTLPPILNALEIYAVKEFQQSPTKQDNVDAINIIKSVYNVDRIWQGDPCLPENYSWEGVGCRYNAFKPPLIISVNLSSSELEGNIDPAFSKLTSLEQLDLSSNSLSGPIPESLSQLTSLKILNLPGNKLSGSVPSVLMDRFQKGTLNLSVNENPDVCFPYPCQKNKKSVTVPIVASVTSVIVLCALAILWRIKRRKQYGFFFKHKKDRAVEVRGQNFTYSEIVAITNDFQKVIGKGGFGTVFHGQLKDGTQVAVKMLSATSSQGSKEFQAEAQLLTRVHHRNLAPLIGYCDEAPNMGLIYEYMANGNLQEHLAGRNASSLTWEQRLQIAIDTAQALEYLHDGCKPPIIHRDVKTANILLNEKLQAKVADFGLCRIFPLESETHVSTAVVGTRGYLDPEYYISNRLNEKSDVYSFGIVLLELISGQPPILKNQENAHIVQWVNRILTKGKIRGIIDSRLGGDYEINSAWKAVETAMACVPSSSIQRPTMSQVVVELKECLEIEISNKRRNSAVNNDIETSLSSIEMVIMDIETSSGPHAR